MHLSFLSDGRPSDSPDNSGVFDDVGAPSRNEAHREGLLRGLALMAIVGMLIAIGFVSSAIHVADTEPAPFADDMTQGPPDAH